MTFKARNKLGQFVKGSNFFLGKHHSKKTKDKLRKINKGKKYSEKTKQKVSKALENQWKLGLRKGIKHTEETKIKMSNTRKGIMPVVNTRTDILFGNIKRGWYDINGKKMFFRSKWEANYAIYLDFLIKQKEIKKWEYEKDMFLFDKIISGTRTYRPDFKVFNNNGKIEYHEVKGWMDARSKTKLKRMEIYYPQIKMVLIDKFVYTDIKKKIGRMLNFF